MAEPLQGTERTHAGPSTGEPTLGELVSQFSEQSSQLVRGELRLAVAELQEKSKHAGVGAGLFGTAGIVALFGVGALVTTAILALALVVPAWLAALLVTVVLFVVAGIAALVGKKQTSRATPPRPERALAGVKHDIETVRESRHHERTS